MRSRKHGRLVPPAAPGTQRNVPQGRDDEGGYLLMLEVILASLLGLTTNSSSMIGVALGLYVPLSKRLLGCILAFASRGRISARAIELAFNGALQLHHLGFGVGAAWSLVGSGFAI